MSISAERARGRVSGESRELHERNTTAWVAIMAFIGFTA